MSTSAPVDMVDLLIVGSGPVGATFARVVSDLAPTATVLLVEAGPRLGPIAGANVRNLPVADRAAAQAASQGPHSERVAADMVVTGAIAARPGTHLLHEHPAGAPDQDGMPAAAMSTNVGGMGAHWTCACPRPGDSEIIDWLPTDELDVAFATAERLLSVTQQGFPVTSWSTAVRDRLAGVFDQGRPVARRVQPMPLACRPGTGLPAWSGADTVLGDLATNLGPTGRVQLWDGTLCRRLILAGDQVTGAELEDRATGNRSIVNARFVVVAADALRTPQLLWASGIRPDALGRYLNDQPQVVTAAYLDTDDTTSTGAAADDVRSASASRDSLTGVQWVPFHEPEHPFHGQVMQLDASPLAFGGSADDRRTVVGLGWFCAKDLRAEDRLEFSDSTVDAMGMPAITVHYGLSDQDTLAVKAAVAAARKAADALGEPVEEPRLLPAGSSLHYQGTTRMTRTDDGTGVCDDTSRVWGHNNLFVGGNGVIPTPTACNPTLTSVALAVRSATHIANQLTRTPGRTHS